MDLRDFFGLPLVKRDPHKTYSTRTRFHRRWFRGPKHFVDPRPTRKHHQMETKRARGLPDVITVPW